MKTLDFTDELHRIANAATPKNDAAQVITNAQNIVKELHANTDADAKADAQQFAESLPGVTSRYAKAPTDFMTPDELNELPSIGNTPDFTKKPITATKEEKEWARNWANEL